MCYPEQNCLFYIIVPSCIEPVRFMYSILVLNYSIYLINNLFNTIRFKIYMFLYNTIFIHIILWSYPRIKVHRIPYRVV